MEKGINRLKNFTYFLKETDKQNKKDSLWIFEGDFIVIKSMVMNGKLIKDKIPDILNGDFECRNLKLTSLEGCPKEIGGFLDCSYNQLTSLEGGPLKIGGIYNCQYNNLTSLEYYPKRIKGEIWSDLTIEKNFINNGFYKNNYWMDLLDYVNKNNRLELSDVKGWPENFKKDNNKFFKLSNSSINRSKISKSNSSIKNRYRRS